MLRGEVTDELLSPAWRRAAAKIRLGTLPASWVRGPISAVLRVVGIIGWDPITPTSWRICGGGVLDLKAVPPLRLKHLAGRAAQRAAWRDAATSRRDAAGSEDGIDLASAGRVSQRASARRKGAALCVLAGGVTTAARRQRQNLQEGDCCEACGAAGADEVHLFWRCPAHAELRREAGFTERFIGDLLRRAPMCFLARGLVPSAWTERPRVAGPAALAGEPPGWWRQAPGRVLTGIVATDGAARQPADRRRRRAAWGLYAVEPGWSLSGALDGEAEFQTVLRAELAAVLETLRRATGDALTLLIDSLCVVDGLASLQVGDAGARVELTGPQCEDADLWRAISDELAQLPGLPLRVRWVPSHTLDPGADPAKCRPKLERARAQEGWDEAWLEYNDLADRAAARGFTLIPGELDGPEWDTAVDEVDRLAAGALGLMADIVIRAAARAPKKAPRGLQLGRMGRPLGRPRVPM